MKERKHVSLLGIDIFAPVAMVSDHFCIHFSVHVQYVSMYKYQRGMIDLHKVNQLKLVRLKMYITQAKWGHESNLALLALEHF